MRLRLASYNIRKCLGSDGKRSPERILDVLAALSADVIALQEVDLRRAPRPHALPPALIAARLGFWPLPVAQGPQSLGWHGQVLLLRPGLVARHVARFDLPALEPRGAVLAEITTADAPHESPALLRVMGVHLGLVRLWRRRQLAAIRQMLAPPILPAAPLPPPATAPPTAILGDFNEWSPRTGLEPLAGAFRIHAPGKSFPARQPLGRLDRIALSPDLQLLGAGVLDTPIARRASDHLPIWADLALPAPEKPPAPQTDRADLAARAAFAPSRSFPAP